MAATNSAVLYAKNDKKITGDFYVMYVSSNKAQFSVEGIPFAELVIVKGEEKYYLYGFTEFRKPNVRIKGTGDNPDSVETENVPTCLQIRHSAGKGWDNDTRSFSKDESPSELEIHIGSIIEEQELASEIEFLHGENLKVWSCKLILDDEQPKFIKNSGFEYLQKVEKVNLPDLPPAEMFKQKPQDQSNSGNSKGSNKSYTPPITEYEKGRDRLKLAIESLPPEWKVTSLTEFAILMDADLADTVHEANGNGLGSVEDSKVRAAVGRAVFELAKTISHAPIGS